MGYPRTLRYASAITLALSAPAAAQAPDTDTGNELLATCSSNEPSHFWTCTGYIGGFFAGMAAGTFESKGQPQICVADTVTYGQLRAVLVKGLEEFPQVRHLPANALTFLIYRRAFPCPAQ